MSYSNSYFSVSNKAQFERPTIPPILKLAQHSANKTTYNSNASFINSSSKGNILNSISNKSNNKFNAILPLNTGIDIVNEKKFLRQKKLLEEQQELTNKASILNSADFDPKLILKKSITL